MAVVVSVDFYIVYPYFRANIVGLSHYATTCCVLGWIYGALFSVSHVNDRVKWYPDGDRIARQLQATIDWAPGNAWVNWFTVGLNHQAVHHVHPTQPSSRYCILRETVCTHSEYRSLPTFWDALCSNARYLKRMGESQEAKVR